MKKVSILILIISFLFFSFWQLTKKQSFEVLEIVSPSEIVLDLNQNGIKDKNELIELTIQTFSPYPSESELKDSERIGLNKTDSIKMGFLAQKFSESLLLGKKVRLKDHKLFFDNKNYAEILLEKGFAYSKEGKPSASLVKNIDNAKKLNIITFNNKSHKYHKLDCKYGLMAHNKELVEKKNLPTDAKPCKFCHSQKEKKKHKKSNSQNYSFEQIPYVKSVPDTFQTDELKIYLTDFTSLLKPNNDCSTKICQAIVNEINLAQSSIDFAIYGYTKIPKLEKALQEAQRRGVCIRFVYDSDEDKKNIYPDTLYLSNLFAKNNYDNIKAIMHNKFFIFDSKKVITGSANISNTDMSGFNSNAVIAVESAQIAQYFSEEFEQMYSNKFHNKKYPIKNKTTVLTTDSQIQAFFAPKEKITTNTIIPLVQNAQNYIYMPTFLITHKNLAQSLIDAKSRGVEVKIIIDATNSHSPSSKHKLLRDNGIQVKTENYAGKLHSKSIIIDDQYTIIGSMNFSKSGENINDENVLVIKNENIARFYKKFFQYLWAKIPTYWLTHNARAESPDSIGSCNDGIDNDFDGKIDKADDSCKIVNSKR